MSQPEGRWIVFFLTPMSFWTRWTVYRALPMLVVLALPAALTAADPSPEPPPDRVKALEKIARTMDSLAKRLKGGSLGEETQRLQEKVLAEFGEAMRRENAAAAKAKTRKERAAIATVAAALEQARARQELIGASVKRLARLGAGKERDVALREMSQHQAKAARILREVIARAKAPPEKGPPPPKATPEDLAKGPRKFHGERAQVEGVVQETQLLKEKYGDYEYRLLLGKDGSLMVWCAGKLAVAKGDAVRITGVFRHDKAAASPFRVLVNGEDGKVEKLPPKKAR